MINKFRVGEPHTLFVNKLNKLVDIVNGLENCTGGPGVNIQKTGSGWVISVPTPEPESRTTQSDGEGPDCTGGELKVLGFTLAEQDTDTWNRDADDRPLSLRVITDVEYDETTRMFSVRTRTMTFNRCGHLREVSGESDDYLIFEAVDCSVE